MPKIALVAVSDADFDWLLGQPGATGDWRLPPGGVDSAATLRLIRRMNAALLAAHDRGAWMIVAAREVVGLCGYLRPPVGGDVEIGFGIAASRRRQGYATAAVAAMRQAADADPVVTRLLARTATGNLASQQVLARNGFVRTGLVTDPEDGELALWQNP